MLHAVIKDGKWGKKDKEKQKFSKLQVFVLKDGCVHSMNGQTELSRQ